MVVIGWINIYDSTLSGFHTTGKPGAYDRHAGDVYATRESALRHCNPAKARIATLCIAWHEGQIITVNPEANAGGATANT